MKIHLFQNIISIHISNQPTTESGLGATEQPAKIYWYWNVTTFLLSVYLVYNYIKQAMFQKFFKIFFEKINTIARLKFFVYVLRPLGLFTWTSFRMNVTLSLFNFFAFLYLYLQICFLWGKLISVSFLITVLNEFTMITAPANRLKAAFF